jgi:SAM-dependent methyltransferase
MTDQSYDHFRKGWEAREAAAAYRQERFTRSRRWRRTARREQTIVARFLATLPQGARVLDIPCGVGRFVPVFREAGIRCVGGDVSLAMLQLARESFGPLPLIGADALRLPFHGGAFDALTAVRLLHRIHERQVRIAILCEMSRVVRGPILVSYYRRWNVRGIRQWLQGKYPGLSLREIQEDVHQSGLRVTRAIPLRRLTDQQWFFRLERP